MPITNGMEKYKYRFVISSCLFLIGIYFYSLNSSRLPAGTREYGKSETNELQEHIEKYLNFIPDYKLKSTIGKYINEVSQIHRGANESIEIANLKLLQTSPCFAEIAADFYLDLLQDDLENLKLKMLKNENRPLGTRIALDEEAGKGFWQSKKPGFLWEKLMSKTNGNPNLAIAIIKMCGHDDAINEKPYLSNTHPNYEKLNKRKIEIINKTLSNWDNKSEFISQYLTFLRNQNRLNFGCLSNSTIYLPKALGEEVSIVESLKEKIEKTQAPILGAKALPAKNYHVLAGLFTGCRFKSESGYSFIGANIAKFGARFYRAKTLTSSKLQGDFVGGIDGWNNIDLTFFSDDRINDLRKLRIDKTYSREGINSDSKYIFLLNPLNDNKIKSMSVSELRNHMWAKVNQIDAAHLWKKWYEKTKIPGIGEVYLPNRNKRPSSINVYYDQLKNNNECGEKWTSKRCKDAIQIMDTWEVDFEWSEEAQYRGARIGEKLCNALPQNQTLETISCNILNHRNENQSALAEKREQEIKSNFQNRPSSVAK
jgi:hypothetical protein